MRTEKVDKTSSLHFQKQPDSCFNSELLKQKKRKSMIARFLEKLAKENEKSYGGTPPRCH